MKAREFIEGVLFLVVIMAIPTVGYLLWGKVGLQFAYVVVILIAVIMWLMNPKPRLRAYIEREKQQEEETGGGPNDGTRVCSTHLH